MKKRYLQPRSMLAVVIVVCVISSLAPTRYVAPITDKLANIRDVVISPASNLWNRLSLLVRRPADQPINRGNPNTLEQRYDEAIVLLSQLEQEILRLTEENRRLSQVNTVLQLEGFQRVQARVAASLRDRLNPRLTISRGENHGMREGLVVVDGVILVGRVTNTSRLTSSVRLITTPNAHLEVVIGAAEDRGRAQPFRTIIQCDKSGEFFTAEAFKDDPVQAGDLVQLADDTWPSEARGFIIGTVESVGPDPYNNLMKTQIKITPTRPLAYLSRVVVLVPVGFESQ